LSQREHSRAELERKLAMHEIVPGELAQALDALQMRGFISEDRVLESVVHRRAGQWGVGRIQHELQAKGLSKDAVAGAVAELRQTELARAQAVWQKKFGNAAHGVQNAHVSDPETALRVAVKPSPAERFKQSQFLLRRGFSGEVVRQVVGG
jgi:regulatory protein